VSVDRSRGSYACHVFRSDTLAAQISDALSTITGHVVSCTPSTSFTVTSSDGVRGRVPVTNCRDVTTRCALRPNSLPNLMTGSRDHYCYDNG